MPSLKLEQLTQSGFADFGDVLEMDGRDWFPINGGTTRRYHCQALVQTAGTDGQAGISLARGDAFHLPINIAMLERHPLGSQAWIPMDGASFIVVVAPDGPDGRPHEGAIRAFYADGSQGVNYHQGTWHHPLLTLGRKGSFIVVDRIGDAPNCDECNLDQHYVIDGAFQNKAVSPLVSM